MLIDDGGSGGGANYDTADRGEAPREAEEHDDTSKGLQHSSGSSISRHVIENEASYCIEFDRNKTGELRGLVRIVKADFLPERYIGEGLAAW